MSPKLSQPTHDFCCRGCEDPKLSRLLDGYARAMDTMSWASDLRMYVWPSGPYKADADAWWLAVQFRAETLKTGRRPDNWHPGG